MRRKSQKLLFIKNEAGFTLIELATVIIILGLVLGIAYGVILLNARTFKVLSDTIVTRMDMRKAMGVVRKDLQELDAQKVFGPTLHAHSGTKLYFKNIDGRQVMYRYVNNMLLRKEVGGIHHGFGLGIYGGWDILLKNLLKQPFQFLDRNMNSTTDINKLAYIKVIFIVKNNGKSPSSMENIFYLRNTAPLAP